MQTQSHTSTLVLWRYLLVVLLLAVGTTACGGGANADAMAHVEEGLYYAGQEEHDQAIAEFTKAIELDPRYPLSYELLGDTYTHKGEYALAIESYSKAIELGSGYAIIYTSRGDAYRHTGAYGQALQDYDKAIAIDPDYEGPYYGRGLVYQAQGDHDNAISDLQKYVEMSTDLDLRQEAEEHLRELGAPVGE